MNLLSYYFYEEMNLRELKPIYTILCLANRSIKIHREVVEDALVQVVLPSSRLFDPRHSIFPASLEDHCWPHAML